MADIERQAWHSNERPKPPRPGIDGLLTALIDRIECGMLVCTPSAELLHANRAAQYELKCGGAVSLVDGHLRCDDESSTAWMTALRDAATRHRSSLLTLGPRSDPLMVAVTSLEHLIEESAVMVLTGRRGACSRLGIELLAKLHGLTFAECRVLRALIGNNTPREIAASHGVALATVRTQIQAVRDKLGVRSIEALLLRAAEIPPITARY